MAYKQAQILYSSFFTFFRRLIGRTSSPLHAPKGTKDSKKPQSSNMFGKSHHPGLATIKVIQKRIKRTIAITMIKPTNPSIPITRYQTSRCNLYGHNGYITAQNTATITSNAIKMLRICEPS